MAYELGYPVDFRSAGDTTREAFSKHINEIKRIYSYLNDLDSNKASKNLDTETAKIKSDLNSHKTSTDPHPNWTPILNFSDLHGSLSYSKIDGLDERIRIISPPFTNKETATCDGSHNMVKLNSNLTIISGMERFLGLPRTAWGDSTVIEITYPWEMPNHTVGLALTLEVYDSSTVWDTTTWANLVPVVVTRKKTGFTFLIHPPDEAADKFSNMAINYIAIGD